jgi:hypothetical protein
MRIVVLGLLVILAACSSATPPQPTSTGTPEPGTAYRTPIPGAVYH